jgi:hypothetical protein
MNAQSLRSKNHRVGCIANNVLAALRRGQTLHLEYCRTGRRWVLSSGQKVGDDVALIVIRRSGVIGDNDVLFPQAKPQTWRSTEVTP